MRPEPKEGMVVISKKGRDKGRHFVVLYQLDADFLLLADGDCRPLEKMKKKRVKHVVAQAYEFPDLIALFKAKQLKNSDLRKALARFSTASSCVRD